MGLHEELTDALSRREDAEEAEREIIDRKVDAMQQQAGLEVLRDAEALRQWGLYLLQPEGVDGFHRASRKLKLSGLARYEDAIDDDFLAPIRDLIG